MKKQIVKIKNAFSTFNWLSGIWLLFLFYPLSTAWPYNTFYKGATLLAIAVFLLVFYKIYQADESAYWDYWLFAGIILEVILTLLTSGGSYMFLYLAWAIGFEESRKYFRLFYLLHVSAYLLLMLYFLFQVHWQLDDLQVALIYGLFVCLAPLAGQTVMRRQEESLQLSQSNERLTRQVKQDERERIARDLHDTLGQSFSMISVKTEFAEKILDKQSDNQAAIRQQLADIADTSRQNLQLVRDIVSDLRRETLSSVLISESENLQAAHIRLLTKGETQVSSWPEDIQNVFAACFSEAVTNIIRYSQAARCLADFKKEGNFYEMVISDNGTGFDETKVRSAAHGLLGIRERLSQADGRLVIKSDHQGTRLSMSLPAKGGVL